MKKIVVAGGTGFVGQHLVRYFVAQGYEVRVLTRDTSKDCAGELFYWDIEKKEVDHRVFEGVDVVVNLVGENIAGKRWSKQQKEKIVNSRRRSAELLYQEIERSSHRPSQYIGASAVGYYGVDAQEEVLTEDQAVGSDFLAEVCASWEQAHARFERLGLNVTIFRLGVVFGRNGGAYPLMTQTLRWGFVNALGGGEQIVPWVHIDDVASALGYAVAKQIGGVYNLVAPDFVTQSQFMNQLTVIRGIRLPNVPAFLVKILLGEMANMLLTGNKISPNKLLEAGFGFQYPSLETALKELER